MEPILGFDVGAWGVVAALAEPTGLQIYPKAGSLPGMVSVDALGAVFVGDKARRKAVLDAENTILSPMRLLGRLPTDDAVRRSQQHAPAKLQAGPAGLLTVEMSGQRYAVPELVAQLIAELKRQAERDLDEKIRKAVFTVPLSFGDVQRQALRLAARIAGLQVLRIISSPMALALSQNAESAISGRWLVVDAGGSQVGAAVIDIHERIIENMGFSAHSSFGALDVDAEILSRLSRMFADTVGLDINRDPAARCRLLMAASNAKKALQQHPRVRIRLRELMQMAGEKVDFDDYLDRTTVETAAQGYSETVLATADEAVSNSGLGMQDLRGAIIGGGGAHLGNITEDLAALLGREKNLHFCDDSDAARGAARYATALVSNPSMSVDDVKIIAIDQLSASLIASTHSGYQEVVLPAGLRLPISSSRVFTTSQPGQNQLRILISQATSGDPKHPDRLGEFVLDGLQQEDPKSPHIEISFDIDSDGLLHVSARDLESGHRTASDVRISESVAEQALATVYQSRGLAEETIRVPISDARMPGAPSQDLNA